MFNHIQRAVAEEYNWDYFRPIVYEPIDVSDKDLNTYTGLFDWEDRFVVVTNEHDVLYIQINNERHKLIPVGENVFLVPDKSLIVIFPKEGGKNLAFWDTNGDYSEATKIY